MLSDNHTLSAPLINDLKKDHNVSIFSSNRTLTQMKVDPFNLTILLFLMILIRLTMRILTDPVISTRWKEQDWDQQASSLIGLH